MILDHIINRFFGSEEDKLNEEICRAEKRIDKYIAKANKTGDPVKHKKWQNKLVAEVERYNELQNQWRGMVN